MTSEERQATVDQAYEDGVTAAEKMDASLGRKPSRGQVWKIGFVLSCFAIGVSLFLGTAAARSVVDIKAEQVASEEQRKAEQKRTREAITALQEANSDLQRRGQQPVPPPADMGGSEALVAAAAARVLANLPPAPLPTDEQIGRALAAHFAVNPVAVSPQRVAQAVANYFAENPVEPGEQGEKGDQGDPGKPGDKGEKGDTGDPGHTPTPEEIMAVFNQAAAQNPNILCAGKGTFTEVVGFVRVPPENLPSERSFWTCLPS